MLLENNYSTGLMPDDRLMNIKIFLQYSPLEHHLQSSVTLLESSITLLRTIIVQVTFMTIVIQRSQYFYSTGHWSITYSSWSCQLCSQRTIIVQVFLIMIVIWRSQYFYSTGYGSITYSHHLRSWSHQLRSQRTIIVQVSLITIVIWRSQYFYSTCPRSIGSIHYEMHSMQIRSNFFQPSSFLSPVTIKWTTRKEQRLYFQLCCDPFMNQL